MSVVGGCGGGIRDSAAQAICCDMITGIDTPGLVAWRSPRLTKKLPVELMLENEILQTLNLEFKFDCN